MFSPQGHMRHVQNHLSKINTLFPQRPFGARRTLASHRHKRTTIRLSNASARCDLTMAHTSSWRDARQVKIIAGVSFEIMVWEVLRMAGVAGATLPKPLLGRAHRLACNFRYRNVSGVRNIYVRKSNFTCESLGSCYANARRRFPKKRYAREQRRM